ncbi:MAG: hypothetical protein Q8P44_05240, partial [Dehalococcoidia bacterium]|nr:hypothetical protein [Dehalococcoidia bacterium]
ILGGIVGFVVGSGVGAIVGGLVLGALGSAVEHWLWQPALSTWSGLGGSLSGLGGLFGGLLGGAGSAIGGFLSWTGGGLAAAGGFVAGLGVQLSALSLPTSLITVPVLGATGGALVFTLWMNTSIVGTAFMRQPIPKVTNPPPGASEYIALDKTGVFSSLGAPISYTLRLTAKTKRLENIQVSDETTFNCAGSPPSVPRKNLTPTPLSLNPGETTTLSYSTDTNPQFNNCTVTNNATATFNVPEEGKTGQIASASFSVTIGSPPATNCPVLGGGILCGSWGSSYSCRHCKPGYYGYDCQGDCNFTGACERATAIDVTVLPAGRDTSDVYLPTIFGENMRWEFKGEREIWDGIFWGYDKIFSAQSTSGKRYNIRLLHLDPGSPSLTVGQIYPSGTKVGNLFDNLDSPGRGHVHVTIAEDGVWKPPDLYFKMCI